MFYLLAAIFLLTSLVMVAVISRRFKGTTAESGFEQALLAASRNAADQLVERLNSQPEIISRLRPDWPEFVGLFTFIAALYAAAADDGDGPRAPAGFPGSRFINKEYELIFFISTASKKEIVAVGNTFHDTIDYFTDDELSELLLNVLSSQPGFSVSRESAQYLSTSVKEVIKPMRSAVAAALDRYVQETQAAANQAG